MDWAGRNWGCGGGGEDCAYYSVRWSADVKWGGGGRGRERWDSEEFRGITAFFLRKRKIIKLEVLLMQSCSKFLYLILIFRKLLLCYLSVTYEHSFAIFCYLYFTYLFSISIWNTYTCKCKYRFIYFIVNTITIKS